MITLLVTQITRFSAGQCHMNSLRTDAGVRSVFTSLFSCKGTAPFKFSPKKCTRALCAEADGDGDGSLLALVAGNWISMRHVLGMISMFNKHFFF